MLDGQAHHEEDEGGEEKVHPRDDEKAFDGDVGGRQRLPRVGDGAFVPSPVEGDAYEHRREARHEEAVRDDLKKWNGDPDSLVGPYRRGERS